MTTPKNPWDDEAFVRNWIAAQRVHGDGWRAELVNPLVLEMCRRIGSGGGAFAFSAYKALSEAGSDGSTPVLKGVRVIDLGCGDGCLGQLVVDNGGSYFGCDRSALLVEHATKRRRLDVSRIDLDSEPGPGHTALRAAIVKARQRMAITMVVVLEHLAEPARILGWLAACLQDQADECPVFVVTLDETWFETNEKARAQKSSPSRGLTEVVIASIAGEPNKVPVRLRSQREFEALFRDAGFIVRACEPLHRPPRSDEHVARLPTFWAWRLSARRGQRRAYESRSAGLVALPEPLRRDLSRAGKGVETLQVAPYEMITRAGMLGGELLVLLEGSALLHEHGGGSDFVSRMGECRDERDAVRQATRQGIAATLLMPGAILGSMETEATGHHAFHWHDVVAGPRGCTVAIVKEPAARKLVDTSKVASPFAAPAHVRARSERVMWQRGLGEVNKGWDKSGVEPGLGKVHELLETSDPVHLWRMARALLWAAALERSHRTSRLAEDVTFLQLKHVHLLFEPFTDEGKVSELNRALRLFQLLRIVDAAPMGKLHLLTKRITRGGQDLTFDEFVDSTGQGLVTTACNMLLRPLFGAARIDDAPLSTFTREINARPRECLVWADQPVAWFKDLCDALKSKLPRGREALAAFEDIKTYLGRLSEFWHDEAGTASLVVVVRDTFALRTIAMGGIAALKRGVVERARHVIPGGLPKRPHWESMLTPLDRMVEYVDVVKSFFEQDLRHSRTLRFSHEMPD